MAKETETKFKIKDPDSFRAKLNEINAEFKYKNLEKDTYYKPNGFKIAASVVRVRVLNENEGVFTIKAPIKGGATSKFKVREEIESKISAPENFKVMIERLGFLPLLRKEKKRETYQLNNASIVLDELPYIGWYAEIEAEDEDIERTIKLLGFNIDNSIKENYMALFGIYKALHKKPDLEMVFPKNTR